MDKRYITDVIGQDYKQWRTGDIIFIDAGTGSGKTTFVRDVIDPLICNVLLIENRKETVKQNEATLQENELSLDRDGNPFSSTRVTTYHQIECDIERKGYSNYFDYRNIIVFDEAHYVISDTYNDGIDTSLNLMEQTIKEGKYIVVFMSATGKVLFDDLRNKYKSMVQDRGNKWLEYYVERDYSHIRSLTYYKSDENILKFLDSIVGNGEKVISFSKSVDHALKLHRRYQDISYFACAKSRKEFKKYSSDDIINKINDDLVTFDRQFLFTTKVYDTGIDIKDETIKYIISDIDDSTSTIIQCLGRKRPVNKDDKVNVILKDINPYRLGGFITGTNNCLNEAEDFMKYGVEHHINKVGKFGERSYNMVYDKYDKETGTITKKLSQSRYLFNKERSETINLINNHGFMNHMASLLKQDKYTCIDTNSKNQSITDYLSTLVGKKFYKADQKEIVEKINHREDGKPKSSIGKINKHLQKQGISYRFVSESDNDRTLPNGSPNPNRGKSYWYCEKV